MKTHLNSELKRCKWCSEDPRYRAYHDYEWGVFVKNDTILFEFILLEGAQAGLSWTTILYRREEYRLAFDQFDFEKIALYGDQKIEELMQNPGIIRNRAKIRSAIKNAQAFQKILQEFGSFINYTQTFFPEPLPLLRKANSLKDIPVENEISKKMSLDIKKRGFTFFGSVICYSHLQATGAINDHTQECFLYAENINKPLGNS